MNEELEKVYEESFYPSAEKFYKICKRLKMTITLSQIKQFIETRTTAQLFKKKARRKGHIIAFAPEERIQMDIIVMDKFGQTNSGNKYILLLIDVFTRKGFAFPMKTKGIKDTSEVLSTFCKTYFTPKIINCDNDSSFLGKQFNKVIDDNKIELIENDVGDHNALGIIDRFVQTIKNTIYKYMKTKNTTNWISSLDNIIESYNKTPHSSIIDIIPNEADTTSNERNIFEINLHKMKETASKPTNFEIGDKVRLEVKKDKLNNRSYAQNYSDKVYEITNVTDKYIYLKDHDKRVPKNDVLNVKQTQTSVSSPVLDTAIQQYKNKKAIDRTGIRNYNNPPMYWKNPFI